MPDYEKLYAGLFNAVTDALEAMSRFDLGVAADILRRAQQDAEERYITAE